MFVEKQSSLSGWVLGIVPLSSGLFSSVCTPLWNLAEKASDVAMRQVFVFALGQGLPGDVACRPHCDLGAITGNNSGVTPGPGRRKLAGRHEYKLYTQRKP